MVTRGRIDIAHSFVSSANASGLSLELILRIDLCSNEDCANPRYRRNGEKSKYCEEHRCAQRNCRGLRGAGSFCRAHNCENPNCTSFVLGDDVARGDEPERFCDRHRICRNIQCPRYCYIRETGFISPFCGAHYCETTDCDNERRRDGRHCSEHACAERPCHKGVESAMGQYCKEHQCKARNCHQRRLGREFCPYHECIVDGCEEEADQNRYCGGHQRREGGWRRTRRPSIRETRHPTYGDRESRIYPWCDKS